MKKRSSKKKRVGEFQELGFKAGFRFSDGRDTKTRNHVVDRFIEEAIEDMGLLFGGGGGESEGNGLVTLDRARGSTSKHHQEAVKQWLMQERDILEYYVTPLIDAWWGDYDGDSWDV